MTIQTVQIRLVGDETAVRGAIQALRDGLGSARVAIPPPRAGRRGEYLAYGTFQFDDGADVPVQLPTPNPPPAPASTGPTEHLAATGPTERLRRRKKNS